MSILAYLAANWQLALIVTVVSIVLGYIAFILKNWKAALAAVVLVLCGFAYEGAWTHGYNARVAEDVKKQTAVLKERLETLDDLAEWQAQRHSDDAAKIEELQKKANETPPNAGSCLDAAGAGRVRSIH